MTYRHFFIGNVYHFSLCSKHRNCTGSDFEINLTYMKKACIHFKRLWIAALKKELVPHVVPQLHTKDDFFRPVPRFENYFSLKHIEKEIVNVWEEQIVPLYDAFPTLIKYDPVDTFQECVTYALSRKKLKSKFVYEWRRRENKVWEMHHDYLYSDSYYNDFEFSTYSGEELFERKAHLYTAHSTALIPLQAYFRGYRVRKKAYEELRRKSAVAIQSSWRKKHAMLLLKKHKQCAIKIQALCRGYYVRRPYGIYQSWALWNIHAVQRPKKRRKKMKKFFYI